MRSSSSTDLVTVLVRVVKAPLQLVYKLCIAPVERSLEPRRERAFLQQLEEIYGSLLTEHEGQVRLLPNHHSAFDYLSAELVFPDRLVTITRGRGEVQVIVDGAEVYESFHEDYVESMRTSVLTLTRSWDDWPTDRT